jgi:microcystin-dependent protein
MAWTTPRTWVAGETLTAALMNQQVRDNWNAAFPTGSLHFRMQAATSVETTVDGFALEANGVAVSRTTYSALQTKLAGLSYPFGSGDGSTTMNLPDLRGRAVVMHATSGGHSSVNALGDSDGVALASRTPAMSDTVSISGSTSTDGSHVHAEVAPNENIAYDGATYTGRAYWWGSPPNTASAGSHSHTFSDTDSVNVTAPYLVVGIWAVKY